MRRFVLCFDDGVGHESRVMGLSLLTHDRERQRAYYRQINPIRKGSSGWGEIRISHIEILNNIEIQNPKAQNSVVLKI